MVKVTGGAVSRTMVGKGMQSRCASQNLLGRGGGKKEVFARRWEKTEGHELDKADGDLVLSGEPSEGAEFSFVETAQQDAVEFDGGKASPENGPETFQKLRERSPRDLAVKIRLEGIEAQIDRLNSGGPKGRGMGGDAGSVGGKG